MPAKSKSQQRFMGMVHALQKGELSSSKVSDKIKDVADKMSDSDAEDFASTKHAGKPEKVAKEVIRKVRESIKSIVKEGQKRDSHKAYMTYYKTYEAFAREAMNLAKTTSKLSGEKTDEKIIIKNFKKYVIPFAGLMNSWDKGQQQNPGLNEGVKAQRAYNNIHKARNEFIERYSKLRKQLNTLKTESPNNEILRLEKQLYKFEMAFIEQSSKLLGSVSKIAQSNLTEGMEINKLKEFINEGGMGILSTDQSDVLQGIVMRNKSKNIKAILKIALKDSMFKGVDKKELLGYIDGARQFVKYMKSHPMESINEDRKWSMYVDDKKIKTYKSKRAAVIAYNKIIKDTDDWKEVSIKLESINEGKKRFYQQDGIARAKYTINFHDGKKKHKDGSDFYDMEIFKNKIELAKFRKELLKKGYKENRGWKKESVNEKISKEEWAEYPKYARKLKPYMQRLLKVPVKVRVIKQANHNPWIDVRVARFGKDVIPNDFRVKAAKSIGASGVRDWDNVSYGNIKSNSVSLKYDEWVKLLGRKV